MKLNKDKLTGIALSFQSKKKSFNAKVSATLKLKLNNKFGKL